MWRMPTIFAIVAICSAFLGYVFDPTAYEAAKVLCFIFLILAVLSLCGEAARRPSH